MSERSRRVTEKRRCLVVRRVKLVWLMVPEELQAAQRDRLGPESPGRGREGERGEGVVVVVVVGGSTKPARLSGREGRAGEEGGAAGGLEAVGMGGGGGGGQPAGAAQLPVVELPQQLLVLHGQTLGHLGLFL